MNRKRLEPWLPLLGAIALGAAVGPTACISDAPIPSCVINNDCGAGEGGADSAGDSGVSASAGLLGRGGVASIGGTGGAASGSGGSTGGVAGSAGSGLSQAGGGSGGSSGSPASAGAGSQSSCCLILPVELPAPCAGQAYSTALNVHNGHGPYQWSVSASAGTWQVIADPTSADGSRATLKGLSSSPTQLTLVVTDTSGHQASSNYSLTPRSTCYFAYVAPEGGQSKLELLDPLLAVHPLTLLNNSGVFDFQFSPDGRFLVYRFGQSADHPHGAHLSLVDLVTLQDQALPLSEDQVTAYAWSADSRTLAVAFGSGADSYLGGARIQTTAGGPDKWQPLTAILSVATSGVSWFGANYLAFAGPSSDTPNLTVVPYLTQLTDSGFDVPTELYDIGFTSPLALKTSDVGFFATGTVGSADSVFYLPIDGDYIVAEHKAEFVAPSGHFTAQLSGDSLQVRAADQDHIAPPQATSPALLGCPKLLTWAEQRERIACVADVAASGSTPAHSELRIFDLSSPVTSPLPVSTVQGYCAAAQAPAAQTCAPLEYDYTEAQSALQTRLFSPSGRWLAFTKTTIQPDASVLYLADLGSASQDPMVVVRNDAIIIDPAQASPVALAFSPDERFLLKQVGQILTMHLLSAPQNTGLASNPIPVSTRIVLDPNAGSTCAEDYATAPQRWCGATNRAKPFRWSPDSTLYAYRSSDNGVNHLTIASIAQFPNSTTYPFVADDCMGACSGDFAFQP